jgi:hypothetical protein
VRTRRRPCDRQCSTGRPPPRRVSSVRNDPCRRESTVRALRWVAVVRDGRIRRSAGP